MPRYTRRYFCQLCSKVKDIDQETICGECCIESNTIFILYTKIIQERPHLNKLSPSELFFRLYKAYKEKENVKQRTSR